MCYVIYYEFYCTQASLTNPSNLNRITITMNPTYKIDEKVLAATACI